MKGRRGYSGHKDMDTASNAPALDGEACAALLLAPQQHLASVLGLEAPQEPVAALLLDHARLVPVIQAQDTGLVRYMDGPIIRPRHSITAAYTIKSESEPLSFCLLYIEPSA